LYFLAIRQGHYEIVKYLIKNNADINKINNKNNSPLSYAEKQG
jgi:ankyrin repeat protein